MKKFFLAALAAATFILGGCSSYVKNLETSNSVLKLDVEDLEITEQITATATATTIFGINWAHLFSDQAGVAGKMPYVIGGNVTTTARGLAVYNLLKENPGYDVVIYPHFDSEYHRPFLGISFITTKETTTVTARLGKLKTK
ncbi:MAG: hypothetical protein HUJ91_01575 [Bacteroidales bacterium]|nr:hypothetical protein [Bacteroidales bacterium]